MLCTVFGVVPAHFLVFPAGKKSKQILESADDRLFPKFVTNEHQDNPTELSTGDVIDGKFEICDITAEKYVQL